MGFYTADICDQHDDKTSVLGAGYSNYGGAEKCQGEIVTISLHKNNSDLIAKKGSYFPRVLFVDGEIINFVK